MAGTWQLERAKIEANGGKLVIRAAQHGIVTHYLETIIRNVKY